jgi:uncharacterized protein YdeI (YjbR/CyaY-like superfamily)
MGKKDPRVDAYIARSAPFAKPVLQHLRKLVHAGCPDVEETFKWGGPAFMHRGILAIMMAFQRHCAFGFRKHALIIDPARLKPRATAMGQFGRITHVSDLPADRVMLGWVRKATRLNDQGIQVLRKPKPPARAPRVPAYFVNAVRKNPKALAAFKDFSARCKREYLEWVTEAKTEATRTRRLTTAVEWMAEGKTRSRKSMKK